MLYALLALFALGLLFLSLGKYRFYQNYINISLSEPRSSTHYTEPDARSPAVRVDSGTVPKIDINSADIDLIMLLPGVGRETALRIIEYRSKNGDFTRVDDLIGVSGIGVKKLEKLKDYVIIR